MFPSFLQPLAAGSLSLREIQEQLAQLQSAVQALQRLDVDRNGALRLTWVNAAPLLALDAVAVQSAVQAGGGDSDDDLTVESDAGTPSYPDIDVLQFHDPDFVLTQPAADTALVSLRPRYVVVITRVCPIRRTVDFGGSVGELTYQAGERVEFSLLEIPSGRIVDRWCEDNLTGCCEGSGSGSGSGGALECCTNEQLCVTITDSSRVLGPDTLVGCIVGTKLLLNNIGSCLADTSDGGSPCWLSDWTLAPNCDCSNPSVWVRTYMTCFLENFAPAFFVYRLHVTVRFADSQPPATDFNLGASDGFIVDRFLTPAESQAFTCNPFLLSFAGTANTGQHFCPDPNHIVTGDQQAAIVTSDLTACGSGSGTGCCPTDNTYCFTLADIPAPCDDVNGDYTLAFYSDFNCEWAIAGSPLTARLYISLLTLTLDAGLGKTATYTATLFDCDLGGTFTRQSSAGCAWPTTITVSKCSPTSDCCADVVLPGTLFMTVTNNAGSCACLANNYNMVGGSTLWESDAEPSGICGHDAVAFQLVCGATEIDGNTYGIPGEFTLLIITTDGGVDTITPILLSTVSCDPLVLSSGSQPVTTPCSGTITIDITE